MNLIGKEVNIPSAAHSKNMLREYPHCSMHGSDYRRLNTKGRDINVKHEMVEEIVNNEDDDSKIRSLTFNEIIKGDKLRTQLTE